MQARLGHLKRNRRHHRHHQLVFCLEMIAKDSTKSEGFMRTLRLVLPALLAAQLAMADDYIHAPEPSSLLLLASTALIIFLIDRTLRARS